MLRIGMCSVYTGEIKKKDFLHWGFLKSSEYTRFRFIQGSVYTDFTVILYFISYVSLEFQYSMINQVSRQSHI